MLKILHYIGLRFSKKYLIRSVPIYLIAALITIVFGVNGLMISFFLGLFFFLGWITHSLWGVVKDYRLTLRLNRVHYTQADYETLRRENKALLQVVEARMEGVRGVQPGVRPASSPAPKAARLSQQDIEEMKFRYEQEEQQEYDRDTHGPSRNG
ncbi:hypothetical protein [Paenibacillus ehimensis]|uniref:Uncharacterized protein n=1 Tax=Paenibacillus ehimensis TaxID=79264 RepID=A0ABT8VM88_9BACL|nr:hypothetical protein [Paenibacillus ehimensis]MDO3682088.1 hypothetical protein [Paenibacillus ehimensis]